VLGTPYLTPQLLFSAPTGVSWSIIPSPEADTTAQQAAATDVIWRSTSRMDTYCNQPLRATIDTELLSGPGMPRCSVNPNTGVGELVMKRWPITSVLAILISPSRAFPRTWSPVPTGQWSIRHPLIYSADAAAPTAPDGGSAIDVAPGYISWRKGGRGGQQVQTSYGNGWPHTSLTAPAARGATTLNVDDVTGWAGAAGFAYDGASTEQIAVSSVTANNALVLPNGAGTAQAGPGTITLTGGLAFRHSKGTLISAFPATLIEAAVYGCCVQALDAGIDALAVQNINGETVSSGQASKDIVTEMELLLDPFRRII
jgi:hypothetical protein